MEHGLLNMFGRPDFFFFSVSLLPEQFTFFFFLIVSFPMIDSTYEKQKIAMHTKQAGWKLK